MRVLHFENETHKMMESTLISPDKRVSVKKRVLLAFFIYEMK